MGRNRAKPRYETKPTPGSKLNQAPILRAVKKLTGGRGALPWQKKAIRLLGELRPASADEKEMYGDLGLKVTYVPRYRQVVATVPRQSGKSFLSKGAITARAEMAPDQSIWATAQDRGYALTHQKELFEMLLGVGYTRLKDKPILPTPEEVEAVHYSTQGGQEIMTWPNASAYHIFAPNKKGGHGASVDFGLIDEAWSLTPDVLQGIGPAMSARPMAQLLIISTMGDMTMTTWNGLVKAGRDATTNPDATMAYIEYSAPDEEAVFDESRWEEWMPALNLTISKENVRADMRLLESDPEEGLTGVVRHYGNLTVASRVNLFPAEWTERAWRVIEAPNRFVLAIHANREPVGASLVTGHVTDGGVATQLYEWKAGSPNWVPNALKEAIANNRVEAVVADLGGGSPTKDLEADIRAICEGHFIPLVDRKPGELAADTGRFYDALREGTVFLSKTPAGGKVEVLEAALRGAAKRTLRDSWLVSASQMSVDASPLIATIMAQGLAAELAVAPIITWPPSIY